jgi:hypothetical protein
MPAQHRKQGDEARGMAGDMQIFFTFQVLPNNSNLVSARKTESPPFGAAAILFVVSAERSVADGFSDVVVDTSHSFVFVCCLV